MWSVNYDGYLLDPFNLEYVPPFVSDSYSLSYAPDNIERGLEAIGVPSYNVIHYNKEQILMEALPTSWKATWRQSFLRSIFFTPVLIRATGPAGNWLMFYYPSQPKIRRYPQIWQALVNAWVQAVDQVASVFISTYYTIAGVRCPALFPYPYSWFYVDVTQGSMWISASPVAGTKLKNINRQSTGKLDKEIGEVSFLPIASIKYGGEYHSEIYDTILSQVYQIARQCFPSINVSALNSELEEFKRKYGVTDRYIGSPIDCFSILTQEFWAMVAWKVWWHYINLREGYPLWQYQFGWIRSFTLYGSGLQFVFPWCYDLPTNSVLARYWGTNLSPELTHFGTPRAFYDDIHTTPQ